MKKTAQSNSAKAGAPTSKAAKAAKPAVKTAKPAAKAKAAAVSQRGTTKPAKPPAKAAAAKVSPPKAKQGPAPRPEAKAAPTAKAEVKSAPPAPKVATKAAVTPKPEVKAAVAKAPAPEVKVAAKAEARPVEAPPIKAAAPAPEPPAPAAAPAALRPPAPRPPVQGMSGKLPPNMPPRGMHGMRPAMQSGEDGGAPVPSAPPKPKGPPVEFKAGDHVVYPTHGVGQVQGIEEMPVAGMSLKVIIVTFEENRMTLRVPVNKAASSGLRKLATNEAMQEALEVLRGRARIKRTMWSRRAQEYEAKINSGDPLAIAEVVRDLHRNAGQPDQSFSERQIYEQALDRLAAELAAIDRTDKVAAAEKLQTFLKAA
jgi:CarD family transcriptional regulator